MNLIAHFRRWLAVPVLLSSILLSSCVTRQVKRVVAETQSALIARNDGSLVADPDGSTQANSDRIRRQTVAKLEELRAQFPEEETAVQANLLFRIAMVTTCGGSTDEAWAAWNKIGGKSIALSKDQAALYRERASLIWLFSKPNERDDPPESSGNFVKRDKTPAQAAVPAFTGIANDTGVSDYFRLWAAYHAAFIAYKYEVASYSDSGAKPDFSAARQLLDQLHARSPDTSLNPRIRDLQGLTGYRGIPGHP